jgi:hypothetical protein
MAEAPRKVERPEAVARRTEGVFESPRPPARRARPLSGLVSQWLPRNVEESLSTDPATQNTPVERGSARGGGGHGVWRAAGGDRDGHPAIGDAGNKGRRDRAALRSAGYGPSCPGGGLTIAIRPRGPAPWPIVDPGRASRGRGDGGCRFVCRRADGPCRETLFAGRTGTPAVVQFVGAADARSRRCGLVPARANEFFRASRRSRCSCRARGFGGARASGADPGGAGDPAARWDSGSATRGGAEAEGGQET